MPISRPRSFGNRVPAGVLLGIAILVEVTGTLSMRAASRGHLVAIGAAVICYAISLGLLTLILRSLPVGFVYAIWAGSGTAVVAVAGMALFGEPATLARLISIAFVIAGVVGLNLAGNH
jgi:small multidrug resistance pump